MTRVLVLHGPNLNLLDEAGITLAALNAQLGAHLGSRGGELRALQSNSEGGLLDGLHQNRSWAEAVLVNPAALAPIAWALADGLALCRIPTVEVLLEAIPPSRGNSALSHVVRAQVHGEGSAGYFTALERLVRHRAPEDGPDEPDEQRPQRPGASSRGKRLGRKAAPTTPAPRGAGKTIGRKERGTSTPESEGPLTRGLLRTKLTDRLAGRVSAEQLAAWARAQWMALQRGARADAGASEALEDLLLLLAASARASDHTILSYLAKLE